MSGGGGYKPGENYFDERVHFLNIVTLSTESQHSQQQITEI